MGFLQAAMTLPGKKGDPPMGKKSEKRAARVAAAIARRKAAGTNPLEFTFTKDGRTMAIEYAPGESDIWLLTLAE